MKVEIWSDIACPWCYIGKRRFEAALAEFPHRDNVEVLWRSYQLDPDLPEHYDGSEVEYLSGRKGMPRDRVAGMLEQVTAQAASVGLDYHYDQLVVANSFTAHRFLHLAKANNLGDAAKEALLSAHFEQGRDIGSHQMLQRIGADLGLDPEAVAETLESDRYTDSVREDIAEARAVGVNGVPFFVIDRKYGISGAQPSELFSQALTQAWQEANPLTMVNSSGQDGEVCGPNGCG